MFNKSQIITSARSLAFLAASLPFVARGQDVNIESLLPVPASVTPAINLHPNIRCLLPSGQVLEGELHSIDNEGLSIGKGKVFRWKKLEKVTFAAGAQLATADRMLVLMDGTKFRFDSINGWGKTVGIISAGNQESVPSKEISHIIFQDLGLMENRAVNEASKLGNEDDVVEVEKYFAGLRTSLEEVLQQARGEAKKNDVIVVKKYDPEDKQKIRVIGYDIASGVVRRVSEQSLTFTPDFDSELSLDLDLKQKIAAVFPVQLSSNIDRKKPFALIRLKDGNEIFVADIKLEGGVMTLTTPGGVKTRKSFDDLLEFDLTCNFASLSDLKTLSESVQIFTAEEKEALKKARQKEAVDPKLLSGITAKLAAIQIKDGGEGEVTIRPFSWAKEYRLSGKYSDFQAELGLLSQGLRTSGLNVVFTVLAKDGSMCSRQVFVLVKEKPEEKIHLELGPNAFKLKIEVQAVSSGEPYTSLAIKNDRLIEK